MKVIQELVAYFDRRGKLSPDEIRTLLDQGHLAGDAPANMLDLREPVGASYYFRVAGATDGPLWGTDIYTGDSSLAAAAVHAGLVNGGETRIVKVTCVTPPASFGGCVRNGVTSHDFGRYGSAYSLSAV
ncbi:MAG TPA: LCCL domain-containing protein [Casimicrobiaceae bacterium]|nr:LCCL domain-containing protein [Casimicrobiaceae bacterium]